MHRKETRGKLTAQIHEIRDSARNALLSRLFTMRIVELMKLMLNRHVIFKQVFKCAEEISSEEMKSSLSLKISVQEIGVYDEDASADSFFHERSFQFSSLRTVS